MTPETAGRRVQDALDRLAGRGDEASVAAAEDLVRELMAFYGEGLARIVTGLQHHGGLPEALLADEVVAGLLVLHELHPEGVQQRIRRALAGLPGQQAELIGYAPSDGSVRIRAAASGGGCGCGGDDALREAVEGALACHAPEVTEVRLERAAPEPALLQIGRRPSVGADAR